MGGSRRRGHEVRNHARAAGYIRVSTEDQTLGPDAQRAALERWASARSVELVGVFEDRGVSGATALDRRPGLLAALDCMTAHGAGLLVAAKRDRFARDVILAAQLERLVERVGAKLVSSSSLPFSGSWPCASSCHASLALPLAPRTPPIPPGRALLAAHPAAPYTWRC